ncbi:hypothetical protein OGH69_02635 [Flavobacterium sp. MFBS3-15]|uniref:hypothetical protein n=1 Tax=Flavobacterium sp. MFBS3-15 TaxID=2989816 RepID=UPI00223667CF|nr:hypothetical protein [Flavobacterium sp. MFBS3-15]MCW4467848.1 hypothetical protein [Flavobacterium sp. MFBS3-15]
MLIFAGAFAVSCEEEETSSVSDDCYDDLIELSDILVARSNTFSNNPTSSNCSSLRTAALNLLDAAQDCDEYGYLYEETAQYWIDLDCSDFD